MSAPVGFPPRVVDLIWTRDKGSCACCGRGLVRERRGIDWAIHHRCPRGAGGAGKRATWVNRAANGVLLCNDCHARIEANRRHARTLGWLVSRLGSDRSRDIAIPHALLGAVYLDDDGGWTSA
ncbi:MAG: hypothetical protein K0R60_1663 [Microbacterium sp.]|jgi:hypothetical protein|nr:hypothetical protein [Microbacterium sp.]